MGDKKTFQTPKRNQLANVRQYIKTTYMIQRIFHPIGQGAFYSERHENINIVYDCGNWKDTRLSDKVVKQSFDANEKIDILFLSHFDFDHVSKISTLKNHVSSIERVVLPLLHDNEKILLSNIFSVLNYDILTLINDPQKYFGEKTKIFYIESTENGENSLNEIENSLNEIENPLDIETLEKENTYKIPSGKAIYLMDRNWVFIPFNFKYKQRNEDLINALLREGFDVKRLQNDTKYTLDEIIKDLKTTKKDGGKRIKSIYDSLDGKINQNTMLLYSGPVQNTKRFKHCFIGNYFYPHHHFYYHCCDVNDRVACIYTGDSDLNFVKLESIYKLLWNNVGTIQIPHHGDIKSFDIQILKNGQYCFPISVGTNNNYGHPSTKVLSEILKEGSCPVLVTEKLDTMFVEIIK